MFNYLTNYSQLRTLADQAFGDRPVASAPSTQLKASKSLCLIDLEFTHLLTSSPSTLFKLPGIERKMCLSLTLHGHIRPQSHNGYTASFIYGHYYLKFDAS
jgi:hypothetical protein